MTKEEYVKSSAEWQALNNIWKSCLPEQKAELRADFEIVSSFINKKMGTSYHPDTDDEYAYLRVSDEAKQFVISLIERGEPNLYHSLMAVLANMRGIDKEEFKKFYFSKYGNKKPYIIADHKLVEEVMDLCWDNFQKNGKKKKNLIPEFNRV